MCYFDTSPHVKEHFVPLKKKPMTAYKVLGLYRYSARNEIEITSPTYRCHWEYKKWISSNFIPRVTGFGRGFYCLKTEAAARRFAKDNDYRLSIYDGFSFVIAELEIAGVVQEFGEQIVTQFDSKRNRFVDYKVKEAGYLAEQARVVRICSGGQRLQKMLAEVLGA